MLDFKFLSTLDIILCLSYNAFVDFWSECLYRGSCELRFLRLALLLWRLCGSRCSTSERLGYVWILSGSLGRSLSFCLFICRWWIICYCSVALCLLVFLFLQEWYQLVFHLIFLDWAASTTIITSFLFLLSYQICRNLTLCIFLASKELGDDLLLHSWLDPASELEVGNGCFKSLLVELFSVDQGYQIHVRTIDLDRLAS